MEKYLFSRTLQHSKLVSCCPMVQQVSPPAQRERQQVQVWWSGFLAFEANLHRRHGAAICLLHTTLQPAAQIPRCEGKTRAQVTVNLKMEEKPFLKWQNLGQWSLMPSWGLFRSQMLLVDNSWWCSFPPCGTITSAFNYLNCIER